MGPDVLIGSDRNHSPPIDGIGTSGATGRGDSHNRADYASSASMRALEAMTSSTVARGLSSKVRRCSGRQKELIIWKSM